MIMLDNQNRPLIAINDEMEICINPKMANRHGLITGATGTGKTITLQNLAETFSDMGIAVFAADVKGDLSGVAKKGGNKDSVNKRVEGYKLAEKGFEFKSFPVQFWDVFGAQGHPVQTTISELGPILLERLLMLNETQGAVLNLIFKIADENDLLLLDMKDLQKMLEYVGNNREEFTTKYGNISTSSVGAIQRNLARLETEGGSVFFGEPSLNINDMIKTNSNGKGMINILAADKLMNSPRIYTTFLLWMLTNLYDNLPEVGDLEKPKLVFFFDEAHLLFNDMPQILLDKVEQIVRLISSKGVGIFFITQNPADIPENILGQLGNRVQHALRAYTPNDQKAVKIAANTFRPNPKFSTENVITELGIGEALVSFLDDKGAPNPVERAFILPPEGQIGPITPEERKNIIQSSLLYGIYEKDIDRISAFEIISEKMKATDLQKQQLEEQKQIEIQKREEEKAQMEEEKRQREAQKNDVFGGLLKDVGRTVGRQMTNQLGRTITRSILGAFFGKK
jgi:DNA helicase HerA-like ATPase